MQAVSPFALATLFSLASGIVFAAEPSIDEFFEKFALEWTRGDPQAATMFQTFQGAEQDALDRQLTPVTDDYQDKRIAAAQRWLAELRRFDRGRLTPRQRLNADMLEWQLDNGIRADRFRDYYFPIEQLNGVQRWNIDFLTAYHPLRNARDAENYLARLAQIGPRLDDACRVAETRVKKGFTPPRFILTATIAQMERFLSPTPRQNVLVVSFAERASKIPGLPANAQAAMATSAEKLVAESIDPAYRRAIVLLQGLIPRSTDDAGLCRYPGGDAAYAACLRSQTSTELTAGQIHEIGLREVARIEREMDQLLRESGLTEGTVVARMKQLDEQSFYPDEPDVRAKILADYDRIIRDAEKRCEAMFDLRPQATVEVRREPEFSEQDAAPHYSWPARDGSHPGVFWVPLPGPKFTRSVYMRSTTYHETVPGHHFQGALQLEMTDRPRFVREHTVFSGVGTGAFEEGWALYAEQLTAESGWYDGDLRGRLGEWDNQLFRAQRLVVDTGLHAKHWTRQQAIDYGLPANEVERYVVWPGQACGYMIGELKILELREKARRALGDKFSLKEFHNVLLRTGCVPLPILDRVIDDYIQTSR